MSTWQLAVAICLTPLPLALAVGGFCVGRLSERHRLAGEGFERALWDWVPDRTHRARQVRVGLSRLA